jgi:hypothetical protein
MLPDVTPRRLWLVRGGAGGGTTSIVVKAESQWEAAYLGASAGLRIVVLHETVPYDVDSGDAACAHFGLTIPSRQISARSPESRAFGPPVTAAHRAVFMTAGIAVALLKLHLASVPLGH